MSDLLRGRFDAVRHVRSIKTPLDQTHVYSIESEDRLATFAVTRFLYRTIGDGRNTTECDKEDLSSEDGETDSQD